MKNNKLISSLCRVVLPVMAFLLLLPCSSSCGKDDKDLMVGYYMSINSKESFMASEDDENQGTTSANPDANVLYTTITRMKRALYDAYPTPRYGGDDVAVLAACDSVYRKYKNMYGALEKNTICVVKIMRTSQDGDIVVKSRTLTTYSFGALPPGKDSSEL